MLIEYVLRISLIAATVSLVLSAMRIKTASGRHAVWTGVVFVMLLLPAWLAWGPRASLPVLPRASAPHTATAMPMVGASEAAPIERHASFLTSSPRSRPSWFTVLYLLGVFTLLLRLAIGTLRTNRLTGASCVVPVTVGFFRPRIILPGTSRDWSPARLDAVLIHEQAHARRRDPLFQWIALLNRAIFWFHPLAWWLERQLSRLAEEACDSAVLAHGYDPHDYSGILLDLSRSVELAGRRVTALAMPMPGAFLTQRIRRMLTSPVAAKISRPRLALTIAACAAAAAVLSSGTLVRAQSPSQPRPSFEVASVKLLDRATMSRDHEGHQLDAGRFVDRTDLLQYIVKAYIDVAGVGCIMKTALGEDCPSISGNLPAWLKTDRWEIQAKPPANSLPSYSARQLRSGDTPELNQMLQVLLEDRFHLRVHRETKELPVYALTVGKNGPKLKPTPSKGELAKAADGTLVEIHGLQGMLAVPSQNSVPRTRLSFQASSLPEAAEGLSRYFDRPVVDRTGLKGDYDFAIEFDKDPDAPGPVTAGNTSGLGGNFFNPYTGLTSEALSVALQDLGLRLEPTKAPVEVLIIDHVEQPSAN